MTARRARGAGNTPVQITHLSTKVDWLSYLLPANTNPLEVLPGCVPAWEVSERKGRYGYRTRLEYLAMEVWSDHGQTDGARVDLSGQACRDLEKMAMDAGLDFSWETHLAWLGGLGARFKRIDLARDVRGVGVDVALFCDAIDAGNVVARWSSDTWNCVRGHGTGKRSGHTEYLGSMDSASRLCIYDKRAEQGLGRDTEPWVRLEFRAKHEVAEALGATIAEQGLAAALETMKGYLRVLDGRGREVAWYTACMGADTAKPLHVQKRGGTVESAEHWIEATTSATLAALVDRRGDAGLVYLHSLVSDGRKKQSARHKTIASVRI